MPWNIKRIYLSPIKIDARAISRKPDKNHLSKNNQKYGKIYRAGSGTIKILLYTLFLEKFEENIIDVIPMSGFSTILITPQMTNLFIKLCFTIHFVVNQ